MVDIVFNNNLDLGEFQLNNAVIQNLASTPSTSYEGRLVYITSDHTLRYWNGTAWAVVSDSATVEALIAAVDLSALATAATLTAAQNTGNCTISIQSQGGTTRTVTIAAANGSAAGVMTPDMVDKLASIAEGAEVNVIESIAVNGSDVEVTAKRVNLSIPTAVSELTNDAGYITVAVSDLTNYYTKSETYTKTEVDQLIGDVGEFHITTVESLPEEGASNTFYLVSKVSSGSRNVYDEYLWINGAWELVGDTEIDLSGYLQRNPGIAAGTHTKISYDANGLVTAGADLAASDIPDLSGTYILQTDKGAASGVATLGTDTKVPVAQLPTGSTANTVPLIGSAASDGQYLVWSASSNAWVPTTLPVQKPFETTITGDGTTADFVIPHGLGYRGISAVYDSSDALVEVARTVDSTNVTLHFGRAPATGTTYTVVVE